MSKKVKPVAKGYHSITAMIAVEDTMKAIQFYKKIFGAKVMNLLKESGGRVAHAEIKIGDSVLMIADENPQYNHTPKSLGATTLIISLYIENVDKIIKKALSSGAKLLIPPRDQFYGDRSGRIEDPFGHVWIISTHIEDVTPKEMLKRYKKLIGNG